MNRPQVVLLTFVFALSPAWTMAREWKDNTGKFSIEAELVDASDSEVVLRSAGRQVLVPRPRLSESDDRFVRLYLIRKKNDPDFDDPSLAVDPQFLQHTDGVRVRLATAPDVDQTLFAVSVLEHAALWAVKNPQWIDPEQLYAMKQREVESLKAAIHKDLEQQRFSTDGSAFNADLLPICDEVLKLIEQLRSYQTSLAQIQAGQVGATAAAEYRVLPGWAIQGIEDGTSTAGGGPLETLFLTLLPYGLAGADALQAGLRAKRELALKQDQQTAALTEATNQELASIGSRVDELCRGLAGKYGWGEKEFSLDRGYGELLTSPASDAVVSSLAWRVKDRPRDPFVRLMYEQALLNSTYEKHEPTKVFLQSGHRCLTALRLIPAGEAFDRYRVQCLALAGEAFGQCVYLEAKSRGIGRFSSGARFRAAHAAECTWATLAELTGDPTGELRLRQGAALLLTGRAKEGRELIAQIRPVCEAAPTGRFVYFQAVLDSVDGNFDEALATLRAGFVGNQLGPAIRNELNTDPDFAALRVARPAEFAELTPGNE